MTGTRRGIPFVISGPSGAGKSTLLRRVLDTDSSLRFSISHTTRQPRPGERDGEDYWFITRAEFQGMIDRNEFLEWAEYNENLYGTSRSAVEGPTREGCDLILEVEVQGADQLRDRLADDAVFVFIEPPSLDELEDRLRRRATDAGAVIEKRLARAREEMLSRDRYDHQVVNDQLPQAVSALQEIIALARARRDE